VGTGLSVTEQEDNGCGWNILILISIVFSIFFMLCAMITRMFETYRTCLSSLVGVRND
jgi:hypothetical protein